MASGEVAALVRPDAKYEGLMMVTSPSEAQRRLQEIQAFVKTNMTPGVDFGVIPGTDKPSLYQPGAQKLAEIYGFSTSFKDVETIQDWERPFFLYRKKAIIESRRDGRFIGEGVGSCNSKESRYAYRWIFANEIPKGIDRSTLKSETKTSRNGKEYTRFRMPNEDIYSLVNTIEKMACKRALVHAVIGATRSSALFTQDVEDLPAEVFGQVEDVRPWHRDAEPAQERDDTASHDKAAFAFKTELSRIGRDGTIAELKAVGAQIGRAGLPTAYREALKEAYAMASAAIVARNALPSEPDAAEGEL
jgi:hypothetical protein